MRRRQNPAHNRRVRKVDVGSIDFGTLKGGVSSMPLDKIKDQDIEVVNPLPLTPLALEGFVQYGA